MKKAIIVFFVLATTVAAGNAQLFVEGIVGVSCGGGKVSEGDVSEKNPTNVRINFMPKAGYHFNDRISVGAKISLISDMTRYTTNDAATGERIKVVSKSADRNFSVFSRYRLLEIKKIALLVEGSAGIGGNSSKLKTGSDQKTVRSSSTVGINVLPLVSYELTEKISIIASCDLLRLEFYHVTAKDADSDRKFTHYFGGFNTQSNIFSELGSIHIGFTYKF